MIPQFQDMVRQAASARGVVAPQDWFDEFHKLDWLRNSVARRIDYDWLYEDLVIMEWRLRSTIGLASVFVQDDRSIKEYPDGHFVHQRTDSGDYFLMFLDSGHSLIYSAWNRVANLADILWPAGGSKTYPHSLLPILQNNIGSPKSDGFLELCQYLAKHFPIKNPDESGLISKRNHSIHNLSTSTGLLRAYLREYLTHIPRGENPDFEPLRKSMEKLLESKQTALAELVFHHQQLLKFVPMIFRMMGDAKRVVRA